MDTENPYMCNNECDASTEELAHPEELMFDFEGRNPTTFWQSTSWKKYPKPLQVNLTLSWNKTIELTDDIILTFESGRPEQMVLEKSLDQGRTWTPYQFYATDCLDAFTMEPKTVSELTQHTLLDIICTEDYSRGYVWKNDKTVRFEIKGRFAHVRAGPGLATTMASPGHGQLDKHQDLEGLLSPSRPGIRLLKPRHGSYAWWRRKPVQDTSNANRSDIKVQGRCKCNLHGNTCVYDKGRLGCECEHNTTGPDCSRCKRHYHGRAWSVGSYLPIPKGTANISMVVLCCGGLLDDKRCKCNLHGNTCVYDKGRLGCECEHNTTGPDCSRCKRHYHGRAWSVGSYLPIPKGTANIWHWNMCYFSSHGVDSNGSLHSENRVSPVFTERQCTLHIVPMKLKRREVHICLREGERQAPSRGRASGSVASAPVELTC
ncbi:hypothetical protein CRUP_002089 [Coryphaenoides rupestris]|nr:hypothetical protein CRUP_002089 [Coryphaenoides rupestris]